MHESRGALIIKYTVYWILSVMLSAQIKAKQTKVGLQVAPMPSSWMHCIRLLYFWYKVSQPGLLKSPIYCFFVRSSVHKGPAKVNSKSMLYLLLQIYLFCSSYSGWSWRFMSTQMYWILFFVIFLTVVSESCLPKVLSTNKSWQIWEIIPKNS